MVYGGLKVCGRRVQASVSTNRSCAGTMPRELVWGFSTMFIYYRLHIPSFDRNFHSVNSTVPATTTRFRSRPSKLAAHLIFDSAYITQRSIDMRQVQSRVIILPAVSR